MIELKFTENSSVFRIDLEDIMLNEISQTEKKILYDITYTWTLKNKLANKAKTIMYKINMLYGYIVQHREYS